MTLRYDNDFNFKLISSLIFNNDLFFLNAVNYGTTSTINLSNNKLTALDQGIFSSILQIFAKGSFDSATAFVDVGSSEFYL